MSVRAGGRQLSFGTTDADYLETAYCLQAYPELPLISYFVAILHKLHILLGRYTN